jgi:drug/metabolite transporter (DMT)-like permease
MALTAIIFGLIAAVSWGLADFLAAKASKRFGGLATGVVVTIISALVFDFVYMLFFHEHTVWSAAGVGFALASGAAFTIANLAFYKGLEHGPVSIVSPLGSLYPLVTTIALVGFFGAVLSPRQYIGIAVVMLGILAASGLFERAKTGRSIGTGPLLGLCGALFWGLAWTFIAQAVVHIGWQFTAAIELTFSSLLFLPLLPLLKRSEVDISKQLLPSMKNFVMVSAGILMMCGFLALSIGLDRVGDLAATAVVISACYPIITVFLALKKLKEKVQIIPLAGAFIGIAGVVILSLG